MFGLPEQVGFWVSLKLAEYEVKVDAVDCPFTSRLEGQHWVRVGLFLGTGDQSSESQSNRVAVLHDEIEVERGRLFPEHLETHVQVLAHQPKALCL